MSSGLRKRKIFRIISICLVFTLVSSSLCPTEALASRSRAGGGKIAKPDWGKVAENVGITIGAAVIGAGLSNSFNSAWNTANQNLVQQSQLIQSIDPLTKSIKFFTDLPQNIVGTFNATSELIVHPIKHFGVGFSSLTSLSEVAPVIIKGYATYAAGSQVCRAVGMAGAYYDWSPKTTFALSSMAIGTTAGFLNPEAALGDTLSPIAPIGSAMLKGAFVGGLTGWATGATIGAIDGDRINEGKSPGAGALLAGAAAGIYAAELGRTLVDPRTYEAVWAEGIKEEYNFEKPDNVEAFEYDSNTDTYKITKIVEGRPISPSYEEYVKSGGGRGPLAGKGPLSESYYNEKMTELMEAKDIGIEPKGLQLQQEVYTKEKWNELNESKGVRIEWTDEGCGIIKYGHPEIVFVIDGIIRMSEEEFIKKFGGQQLEDKLRVWLKDPDYSLSPAASGIYKDPRTSISNYPNLPGQFKVRLKYEGQVLEFPATANEIEFAYNVMPGYPRIGKESFFITTGNPPTGSQVAGRILLAPLTKTLDHWPLLAARALSLGSTNWNVVKKGSIWEPLVSEAVSAVAAPLLDNFANIYNLKLGLATNIDEKLGYYPALKVQREYMFKQAGEEKLFQHVTEEFKGTLRLVKVRVDVGNGNIEERYRAIDDVDNKEKEFTIEQIKALRDRGFATGVDKDARIVDVYKPTISDGVLELVKVRVATDDGKIVERYRAIDDVRNKEKEFSDEAITALEKLGVKPTTADLQRRIIELPVVGFPDVFPKTFNLTQNQKKEAWTTYLEGAKEFPKHSLDKVKDEQVKLLHLAIGNAIDSSLKDVKITQEEIFKRIGGKTSELLLTTATNVFNYDLPLALISGSIEVGMNELLDGKSPSKAMRASLGTVVATSIVRGIIWDAYSQDIFARQTKGKDSAELSLRYEPLSEVDRIFKYIAEGPVEGPTRFYVEKVNKFLGEEGELTPEGIGNLQTKLNWLNERLDLGLSPEEIDLSRRDVNLGRIQQLINDKISSSNLEDILKIEEEGSLLKAWPKLLSNAVESVQKIDQTVIPQDMEALQKRLNFLNDKLGLGLSPEEIDLSRRDVNLGRIQQLIKDKISGSNLEDILKTEEERSLLKAWPGLLSKMGDWVQRMRGPYRLASDLKIDPGTGKISEERSLFEADSVTVIRTKRNLEDILKMQKKDSLLKAWPGVLSKAGESVESIRTSIVTREVAESLGVSYPVIENDTITRKIYYNKLYNGEEIKEIYPILGPPPGLPRTIVGSLSQGLFEFGWQSLAMGLPHTTGGKMGSYAWVNYLDMLKQLTTAAATGGIFNVMHQYATATGVAQTFGVSKNLIGRNILTTIADTPLGENRGMAPLVAITGYKGMPFSLAVKMEAGFKETKTLFYPYWPYQRLSVIPHDPFWRHIRSTMAARYTGIPVTPERENEGLSREKSK